MAENQPGPIKPGKYVLPTSYAAFLKRQNDIFTNDFITSRKLVEGGAKCTLPDKEHCYYVGLIHDSDIAAKAKSMSEEISKQVSGVLYNETNLHTTMANGGITRGEFTANPNVIDKLGVIVRAARKESFSPLTYHAWLANQSGVIAAAYGSEDFFNFALAINSGARNAGIDVNFPWGAHMSVSRFSEDREPRSLNGLQDLLNSEMPLGKSRAVKIGIGTAYTTKTEFVLTELDFVHL